MENKIYDILEPYEDEVLFSWVIRMIRLYSTTEKLTHMDEYLKFLFDHDTLRYPGLYCQRGLDYFVENCDLENSAFFSSEEMMYERLSVLPFYFSFCTEEQKETIKKEISNTSNYWFIESKLGIRSGHYYIEGQSYYKFCPECVKLQKGVYLKREHQIQGNVVCWEHGCSLQKLPYSINWKDIDFPTNIYSGRNITSNELSELDYTKAARIAEMVHDIFINGFQDNFCALKEKIMHRLKALKIVSNNGKFYDLDGFIRDLDIGYLYKKVSIKKDIISAVFVSSRIPNPIIYLILILHLFGSLEEYYAYEYMEGAAVSVKYIDIFNEAVEERNYELSFYLSNLPKWFENEYLILGETKDNIVIKHLKCGTCFKRSKKIRKFKKCRACDKRKGATVEVNILESYSNRNAYYVSTSEYGQMHGRKKKQIQIYFHENRIPGAIRVGNEILVPIDAPYPDDQRIKKNRK